MGDDVYLTRQGYERLKDEYDRMTGPKRREISKQVEEARLKGDLRENAEYDAAKEAQADLERRISELENKLNHARIIENEDIPHDKVYIGATVTMIDQDTEAQETYMLVSKEEANYEQNRISIESPIGKALLGKKVGEIVTIVVPAGTLRYKIINIKR